MTRSTTRDESIRAFGYVARPKREAVQDGVVNKYWTVRCRRKGEEGEWGLGTFATRRLAEQAFHAWVMARQQTPVPPGGKALILDVLQEYRTAVGTMTDKRDRTIRSRVYTAGQLETWIRATNPTLTIHAFDDAHFNAYKTWLESRHTPQTCSTAVVGCRTFLKWAGASGFVSEPPKAPIVNVPVAQRQPLYADEFQAVVEAAEPPVNLLLLLLWESGLRITEALTLRKKDIVLEGAGARNGFVVVESHGSFVPKTSQSSRKVPVSRDLAQDLRNLAQDDDKLLFPTKSGHTYHYWRDRLKKAQVAARLPENERFTFHDLRRARADCLRRAGTPVDVYCRYLGHSEITGLKHYSVVSDEDLVKALEQGLANSRLRGPS